MSGFNSWEEVKEHLLEGEYVSHYVWWFNKHGMSCTEFCCEEVYEDIEEAIESVKYYCDDLEDLIKR